MGLYKEQIHAYVQCHRREIVAELKELLAISSVRGEATVGAPFGPGPAAALEYCRQLYTKHGYATDLDAEGGYLLSYYNSDVIGHGDIQADRNSLHRKRIGLFAHVDTVEPGRDWIYTEPFIPLEKDGFLICRGAVDNKAAVIMSLYCARVLRELALPFSSRLVMFAGGNEETGMQDIRNYTARHIPPAFSLVCDTGFPFYRGDKGRIVVRVSSDRAFRGIRDFSGGKSVNVILGEGQVRLDYDEALYGALKSKETERVKVFVKTQEIVVTAKGISGHGAVPKGSLNAGYLAAQFLAECELICDRDRRILALAAELLKHYYGEPFSIENTDPDFGPLTCTNGIIKTVDGKLELTFDIRFGKAIREDMIIDACREWSQKTGWEVQAELKSRPWILDRENPYVKALLGVYREFTGEANAEPHVNAGMTYAGYLPCAVETGPQLWKRIPFPMPAGHGGAHQPDECVSVDGLLEAIELTVEMLLECDKVPPSV